MKTIGNKFRIFEAIDAKGYADYGYEATTRLTPNPGAAVWTKAALGLEVASIFNQFTFLSASDDLRYDGVEKALLNITADILLTGISVTPTVIGYNLGRQVGPDYVPYVNFNTKFELLNLGDNKWVHTELTQEFDTNQILNILVNTNSPTDPIAIKAYQVTVYII